jgi:hypothetical protein
VFGFSAEILVRTFGRFEVGAQFRAHQSWPGIQIVVEHTVAEDNWVMG